MKEKKKKIFVEGESPTLKKNNTTTMQFKRLRTLVLEIFKTVHDINSSFLEDIFTPKALFR